MEQYLQLTPQQFDQDKTGGWRILCDQGLVDYIMSEKKDNSKIHQAIDIMKYYVEHYYFGLDDEYMRQLIRFHIGQLHAYLGEYDDALVDLIGLQNECYDKVGVGYLDFTIKFLQGYMDQCENIVQGLTPDGSSINTETMQRMIKYKNYSYLEAYSGMRGEELKQWIIENKK